MSAKMKKGDYQTMKKTRIIAIALCLILCLALFAGCSSNANTPATNAPSDNNTPADTNTPADGGEDVEAPTMTIKVNSFLTESSPLTDGTKAIVANIPEYTNGTIQTEGYYNGNLIGFMDTWEAIGNGTIDMGYIGPVCMDSYSVLTPMFSIPTMGLSLEGPIAMSEIYNEVIQACPDFAAELAKSNMVCVWAESLCGTGIHHSKVLATTPDLVKGSTIEGLGKTTSSYFEALGCTTVSLDPGDYYTSLERGIIDSMYASVGGTYNFQLSELLPYHVNFGLEEYADKSPSGAGISTGIMLYCMNLDTWNSMTAEQQEQVVAATKAGSDVGLQKDVDSQVAALADWNSNDKYEVAWVWGDEAQVWVDQAQPILEAWIKTATDAGYDGQGMWDTYQQILADHAA
jgi:TRAP-type C4-dicarboxylate transport system substrate-binding protein